MTASTDGVEEGQKALAIVESAIAKMEDKNETQFD